MKLIIFHLFVCLTLFVATGCCGVSGAGCDDQLNINIFIKKPILQEGQYQLHLSALKLGSCSWDFNIPKLSDREGAKQFLGLTGVTKKNCSFRSYKLFEYYNGDKEINLITMKFENLRFGENLSIPNPEKIEVSITSNNSKVIETMFTPKYSSTQISTCRICYSANKDIEIN